MMDRIKIVRGEDHSFVLKVRTKDGLDPLDLTSVTKITMELMKSNRTVLALSTTTIPPVAATYVMNSTSFVASTAGALGNEITLVGNGVNTIAEAVEEWNQSNPMNQVEVSGLTSSRMPEGMIMLTGGYDAYIPLQVSGNPVLGKVSVTIPDNATKSLRLGLNQSFVLKLDFGPHPSGTRIIASYRNKLDVIEPAGF